MENSRPRIKVIYAWLYAKNQLETVLTILEDKEGVRAHQMHSSSGSAA